MKKKYIKWFFHLKIELIGFREHIVRYQRTLMFPIFFFPFWTAYLPWTETLLYIQPILTGKLHGNKILNGGWYAIHSLHYLVMVRPFRPSSLFLNYDVSMIFFFKNIFEFHQTISGLLIKTKNTKNYQT